MFENDFLDGVTCLIKRTGDCESNNFYSHIPATEHRPKENNQIYYSI